MSERSLLSLRNVTKSYGAKVALTDIDFDISPNEKIAVVGDSGSGKSTLLNILSTLDSGSAGEFLWKGEDLARYWNVQMTSSERGGRSLGGALLASVHNMIHFFVADKIQRRVRRQMGFVFQTPFMLSNFSVSENISISFAVATGQTLAEGDLKHVLAQMQLTEQASQTADQLSGGQRQRVAIGRALIHRPEIVFADEPTGNLDPQTAATVMKILTEICDETGAALVLVTHQPEIACDYTDRVVGIRDGRIQFEQQNPQLEDVVDWLYGRVATPAQEV